MAGKVNDKIADKNREDLLVFLRRIQKEGAKTYGIGINNAPIWLLIELVSESREYHTGFYWPTLVTWYRKAKEFDNVTRGGLPPPDSIVKEQIEVPDEDDGTPKTFGK